MIINDTPANTLYVPGDGYFDFSRQPGGSLLDGTVLLSNSTARSSTIPAVFVKGGTLRLASAGALGSAPAMTVGAPDANATMATLDLNGNNLAVTSLSGASVGVVTNSSVTAAASLSVSVPAPTTSTYAGTITNGAQALSLNVQGPGTLLLSGTNTYTGPTTINQGKLAVSGSLTSAVTVNSGGTLGGTGFLSSVTINPGGNLVPGASLGTLEISGNLILESSAAMDYELDTPTTSSMISCGGLALNGQQLTDFSFAPTASFGPGVYDLIEASSIPSGTLGSNTSGTIDGYPATLAVQGNDVVLTVVPEPSTLAMLVAGVLALLACIRRKRLAAPNG